MESISSISMIVSCILAVISLVALIINKVKSMSEIKEGLKALLRNDIEKLYYANFEQKTLREYERKNLDSLASAYFQLKGNSFAHDIYEEMRDWAIIR